MNSSLIILQNWREHCIDKLQHPLSQPPPPCHVSARSQMLSTKFLCSYCLWGVAQKCCRYAVMNCHYESPREPDMVESTEYQQLVRSAGVQEKVMVHQGVKCRSAGTAYRWIPAHFKHWVLVLEMVTPWTWSKLRVLTQILSWTH